MKIIVNGAKGRMGKVLCELINASDKYELAAAVDTFATEEEEGLIADINSFEGEADCIIDFSHHTCAPALCEYASKHGMPLVIATTAHTDEEKSVIKKASERAPIFLSANMSLGIAVTAKLVKEAMAFFPDAEVEIVEIHHDRKLDVPSGTALILANEVVDARPDSKIVIGRHENGKRTKNEIAVHSLRYGNVVGDHEVIISAGTQTIHIRHEAHDRSLFAEGALAAADFLYDKAPGMYDMKNVVGD